LFLVKYFNGKEAEKGHQFCNIAAVLVQSLENHKDIGNFLEYY
jgi:hypothetical protein